MTKSDASHVRVNGEYIPLAQGQTLAGLVTALYSGPGAVVTEVNGAILPKEQWADIVLNAGDSIEIVHFVGGG